MLRFGWAITIIAGLLLLLGFWLMGNNLLAIIIPICLFYFGISFIWPNTFASSFTPFGHIAGCAAALYGSLQIGGAAVIGSMMSFLPHQNAIPLALSFIIIAALTWIFYESVVNRATVPGNEAKS